MKITNITVKTDSVLTKIRTSYQVPTQKSASNTEINYPVTYDCSSRTKQYSEPLNSDIIAL